MQPPTTIHAPPSLSSFTPLSEHQASTPSTFFSSTPVLHYYGPNARALIAPEQLSSIPIFGEAQTATTEEAQAPAEGQNGTADTNGTSTTTSTGQRVFPVDIYVSSVNLTLFSPVTKLGLEIPYQAITLHAIQRLPSPTPSADSTTETVQGLYMQLDLSPPSDEDEFAEPIELILLPPSMPSEAAAAATPTTPSEEPIKALFSAVSTCSNLHPDAVESDEEMDYGTDDRIVFEGSVGYEGVSGLPGVLRGAADGGLPPPFPGSGGWITAENVGEFFDAEGQWIGGEEEEAEEKEGKRGNGPEGAGDEQGAKRPRVE